VGDREGVRPTHERHRRPAALLALLGAGGRRGGVAAAVLFAGGAAMLAWSGVIHLHLWASGYRNIAGATGPLFLMQGIVAIALALTALVTRRVWAALLGAGFALSTIGGFLISVNWGLFGFQDSLTAGYGELSIWVEGTAAALFGAAAVVTVWHVGSPGGRTERTDRPDPAGRDEPDAPLGSTTERAIGAERG